MIHIIKVIFSLIESLIFSKDKEKKIIINLDKKNMQFIKNRIFINLNKLIMGIMYKYDIN